MTQFPALRRAVRPIYQELGIIPQPESITPAESIQS
jgi:hypothetical protein